MTAPTTAARRGRTTRASSSAGLVELWRATGEGELLAQARRIADAAHRRTLVHPDGVLREPDEPAADNRDAHAFKGIFARGLGRLPRSGREVGFDPPRTCASCVPTPTPWPPGPATAAHGYGPSWAGPPRPVNAATQASACLLLGEVARLS